MTLIDTTGMPSGLHHIRWWNEIGRHYGALDAFHNEGSIREVRAYTKGHLHRLEATWRSIHHADLKNEFSQSFRRQIEVSRMIERQLSEWIDLIDATAAGGADHPRNPAT